MNLTFLTQDDMTATIDDIFLRDGDRFINTRPALDGLFSEIKLDLIQLGLEGFKATAVPNSLRSFNPATLQGLLSRQDGDLTPRIGNRLPEVVADPLELPPVALDSNVASFFFSLQSSTRVGGTTFRNEDIVSFNAATQSFSTLFDGSDVSLGPLSIDAFDIISDTEILLSFTAPRNISGLAVDDSDIVRFTASQLGSVTAGSFDLWLDGSDVGLTRRGEDIDGIQLLVDGTVLISTSGSAKVPGIGSVADEDILRFDPNSLGNATSGTWSLYLDSSDIGLANSNGEDVTAIGLDSNNNLHLSTVGGFSAPGIAGADEDVFVFETLTTGNNTTGRFKPELFFDGRDLGISGDIRGLDLAIGFESSPGPTNTAPIANNDTFTLDTNSTFDLNAPGVLANDTDADGDNLSVSLVSNVNNGSLTLNGNGSFSYTPTAGFSGTDSFTYAASDGNATDNATVTLIVNAPPPPPPSEFNIEVNFTDNSLTASQQAIFTDAANRWTEIIQGDIPDVFVAGVGLVDDLVINASAPVIDGVGSILGQAGPTSIRSGSFLPATGVMEFDAADLANLEANGQLENVILHEMGHVLGIGTVWDFFPDLLTGAGSANPRFNGIQATAEYNSIFGLNASSVPVANTGGPGTRDAHWRESVFGNELLTGFLNSGINPISSITIGSLADIGYDVNLSAADLYTPPSSLVAGNSSPSTSSGSGLIGSLMDHDHSLEMAGGDHLHLLEPEITFV